MIDEALVELKKIMYNHFEDCRAKEIITYNFFRNKFPDEICDLAEELYLKEEGEKLK